MSVGSVSVAPKGPCDPTFEELAQMTGPELLTQLDLKQGEVVRKDGRIKELEAEVLKLSQKLTHAIADSMAVVERGEAATRDTLAQEEQEQWAQIRGQVAARRAAAATPVPRTDSDILAAAPVRRHTGISLGMSARRGSAYSVSPAPPLSGHGGVSIQASASAAVIDLLDSPMSPAWRDPHPPAVSPGGASRRVVHSVLSGGGARLPQEFWLAKRPDKDFGTCQYDPGESLVHIAFQKQRMQRTLWQRRGIGLFRWILSFLIGVVTAAVAFFINYFTKVIFDWKFDWIVDAIGDCDGCKMKPLGMYAGVNAGFTAIAAVLVFISPVAAGSGIPEIKCYLNGVKIPGVLRLQSLVAKATGVLFSVCAGLPCGKEGPMIHSGAIVAAGLSQGQARHLGFRLFDGPYEELRNDREKRDFVSCGAAAGVSAAFGAPVGGLLFALEEGCSFWKPELIWRIFFCSIVSAFTMAFLTAQEDRKKALNAPGMIDFGDFTTGESVPWKSDEVPIFILVGVIGGLLGAVFNRTNMVITRWRLRAAQALDRFLARRSLASIRRTVVSSSSERDELLDDAQTKTCWDRLRPGEGVAAERGYGWRAVRVFEAVLVSLLCSGCAFLCMGAFPEECLPDPCPPNGSGPDCGGGTAADETDDWRKVYCSSKDEVNEWATLWLNPLAATLRTLFHTKAHFSPGVLVAFTAIFFALSVLNYGTGVPSGLFVPSLVTGATYGRLIGLWLQKTDTYAAIDVGTYSLVGAASFLGGVCRITFSLTVILIEATRDIAFALPLMIAIMTAKFTGDFFSKGIYDEHIEFRKVPFLEAQVPESLGVGQRGGQTLTIRDLLISDIMSPPPTRPRVGVRLRCASVTTAGARGWAVVTAFPGEQAEYVSLLYDGHLQPVTVSRQWWEEEAKPQFPKDSEKPSRLLTLPPVCRVSRILEVLNAEVCGFPVVASQTEDGDEVDLGAVSAHDGLITRMSLFVLLKNRHDEDTPTFSCTRPVRLVPRDKAGVRVLMPEEDWERLSPVVSGATRRGFVHCRDTTTLVEGVTCRKVYADATCDDASAIPVPTRWVEDAPIEDLSRALPYSRFLSRYPQRDKHYDSIRNGKERLGLRVLETLRDAIYLEGEDDKYVDLRPYMNGQPYVVPDNFSFLRAYALFRAVGMRHMLVVNAQHRIQGIVTRSDLYKTVHVAEALHHGHHVPLQYSGCDDESEDDIADVF
eukprot:TRINITY_DN4262_c5_g1_i1.p1 TRINITY_DN4262_c5_g1~~TRINITY_DN4262_c5_g1_i1.p1  ORF type:complete len:1271 (+),score=408.05 TRINITY_DN4262_c5_g1_i1:191-3814(+)